MTVMPDSKPKPQKFVGRTVSLFCPHCKTEQQVRPDGVSMFCQQCHQLIDIQEVLHPKTKSMKTTVKTVPLICPSCQHEEQVRPDGISVFCKKCHNAIDIQQTLHPTKQTEQKTTEVKAVLCFRCKAELTPSINAQAVLCKKCGYRNDLQDYHVKGVLSHDIETYGILDVPSNATVLNATARVRDAMIHGKYIGKLTAENEIVLKSGALFEGGLKAYSLVLESNAQCNIKKEFSVKRIVIAGHYYGNIIAGQFVELKKTANFVGSIVTQNLIVEAGASLMGEVKVGPHLRENAEQV